MHCRHNDPCPTQNHKYAAHAKTISSPESNVPASTTENIFWPLFQNDVSDGCFTKQTWRKATSAIEYVPRSLLGARNPPPLQSSHSRFHFRAGSRPASKPYFFSTAPFLPKSNQRSGSPFDQTTPLVALSSTGAQLLLSRKLMIYIRACASNFVN